MSNYIKVFTGNFIEVQHMLELLEEVNICAIIKDESESARLAGFGFPMDGLKEIHVHKDELERATPIIESSNSTSELKLE